MMKLKNLMLPHFRRGTRKNPAERLASKLLNRKFIISFEIDLCRAMIFIMSKFVLKKRGFFVLLEWF